MTGVCLSFGTSALIADCSYALHTGFREMPEQVDTLLVVANWIRSVRLLINSE